MSDTTFDRWKGGLLSTRPKINDNHTFASLARELQSFIDNRSDEHHDCWNMDDEYGAKYEAGSIYLAYALMEQLDGYESVFK